MAVEVIQTVNHTLEYATNFSLGHLLADFAVVLDLVEQAVGVELVVQSVNSGTGSTKRETLVTLHPLHSDVLA